MSLFWEDLRQSSHHVVEGLPELDQPIDEALDDLEARVGLARAVHNQQVALCSSAKQPQMNTRP